MAGGTFDPASTAGNRPGGRWTNQSAHNPYNALMRIYVAVGALVFLGINLFIEQLKWFLDPAYFEGLWAVPILLLANLMLGIYYNQSIWYKAGTDTRWGLYLSLAGAALTLAGNGLLVPHWGYYGSAVATLICYTGMVALSHVAGRQRNPIRYDWPRVLRSLALALLGWGLFLGLATLITGGALLAAQLLLLAGFLAWTYHDVRSCRVA